LQRTLWSTPGRISGSRGRVPATAFKLRELFASMTLIGHLDLDAFFARCEELRDPDLEEKPVVVCVYTRGGSSGAVSTCNYEARELGIGSAMPLNEARARATEETVFLPVDHDYYRKMSGKVLSALRNRSPEVQKYSIDEAFFRIEKEPVRTAKKVKADIEALGLSASIGIGPNKFVAKMASEEEKPDGLTFVETGEVEDFLSDKPVEDIHGVGDRTAEKLREMGVERCRDIREANSARLVDELGKSRAASLRAKARGKGSRELESEDRKQMSKIVTMEQNSSDFGYVSKELSRACRKLSDRLSDEGTAFSKVGVVAVDSELQSYSRSRSVKTSRPGPRLFGEAERLLEEMMSQEELEVRRVGVRASGLVDTDRQKTLGAF
jgi:DNA polymerase IV (DinB-like DNA polymerase)